MPDEDGVIATHYRIDPSRPGPKLQGGLRAFAVVDQRDTAQSLIAVETRPDLPARPRISLAHSGTPVPHAVMPVEYGPGRDMAGKTGWYVVAEGVTGAPLRAGLQPWREPDLIASVLLPAASALLALQARGLTHRAINIDNLFRAGMRDPVTLGPFWAAPPASLQPAVFEPPYMARCLPSGRGDGVIADDVYALGVTLLSLALGRVPLEGMDDDAMLRLKTEAGTFAALTAEAGLPSLLSDLLRGMLAEDPDHRPSPALLLKPEQARARRVAARPPRRAQTAFKIGGTTVLSARMLALELGLHPDRAYQMLKAGDVELWLRRCLGDPQAGMRIEDATRRHDQSGPDDPRGQAQLVMRCVAAIDPLAPLVWRGIAVQPGGIGSVMASAPDGVVAMEEIIATDSIPAYIAAGRSRPEQAGAREERRDWRNWLTMRGPAGGTKRLTYGTNPMMPCQSPLLSGLSVVRAADLLPALDAVAAGTDRNRPPIDGHIAAFLAARAETSLSSELSQISSFAKPADRLAALRLFARLQERLHPAPLPGVAGWLVTSGFAALDNWQSRSTRHQLKQKLDLAANQGSIVTVLQLVDDEPARRADHVGATQARARARQLKQDLLDIADATPKRALVAGQLGTEIVTGASLLASLGAAIMLAL